jgi:hypothetical protein
MKRSTDYHNYHCFLSETLGSIPCKTPAVPSEFVLVYLSQFKKMLAQYVTCPSFTRYIYFHSWRYATCVTEELPLNKVTNKYKILPVNVLQRLDSVLKIIIRCKISSPIIFCFCLSWLRRLNCQRLHTLELTPISKSTISHTSNTILSFKGILI